MNDLQQAINNLFEHPDFQSLKKSSADLSAFYRQGESLRSSQHMLTYLTVRLPATYASACYVFSQIKESGSILDIGAGPGTVWWAARSAWGTATAVTAIEREAVFIELGKKLGSQVSWIQGDVASINDFAPHDWVIFSYSLGEIAPHLVEKVLANCWHAANKGIIIIEPGTPRGYQHMLSARDLLINQGGSLLAPCPHSLKCPLKSPDWCHFSVRLERSFLHRTIKHATLPFEDEKFSYAIITKKSHPPTGSRILRPPIHHSGHINISLCTPQGLLSTITIARSQKEVYKIARKSKWGDSLIN